METRHGGPERGRGSRLTCRVRLLLLGVHELLPLILGPDPLLPQEAGHRGEEVGSRPAGPTGTLPEPACGPAPGRTTGQGALSVSPGLAEAGLGPRL